MLYFLKKLQAKLRSYHVRYNNPTSQKEDHSSLHRRHVRALLGLVNLDLVLSNGRLNSTNSNPNSAFDVCCRYVRIGDRGGGISRMNRTSLKSKE